MMTRRERVRIWWLAAWLAAAWLAPACASNRTPERSFTTRADAGAAGVFDAAGIPAALVPASARQIRERRDLDRGAIWVRFDFDAGDLPPLADRCVPTGEARLPGSATRGIGWWPELLRGDAAAARQHFTLYACRESGGAIAFAAVHRAMPTAFYWRDTGAGE